MTHPIYPCIWFDNQAKEAAEFYCSVFSNSRITEDNPMVTRFESSGQQFMCLNGGPQFTPNASISFFVVCDDDAECDSAWEKLSEGGNVLMPLDKYDWSDKYGWIQDKYGVSWQLSVGKLEDVGQKFTPSFLFVNEQNGNAEKAIETYTSIFKGSSVVGIMRYGQGRDEPENNIAHAQFHLGDNVFMAMDSSLDHLFSFNEGISLVIECDTQQEIDYYWEKLTEGGEESMCGWLKDRYGVSWQIVPTILGKLMKDPEKSQAVIHAFMQMRKFDIEKLLHAHES